MPTFGSLFAGIGGIDLGLERAGWTCKWQVEIDDYCRRVLAKHWPNVKRYGDVQDCGRHNLETVDLIAGGFPCQPVSVAGKRKGQSDSRWLWPDFARVVSELRPQFVFVENVPGLLHRGMGDILVDLAASGYDAEWDCIPASAFLARHERKRVWIVAYTQGDRDQRINRAMGSPTQDSEKQNDGAKPERSSADVAYTHKSRLQGRELLPQCASEQSFGASSMAHPPRIFTSESRRTRAGGQGLSDGDFCAGSGPDTDYWAAEPNVGRVAHGVPSRVDRLRGLGNAVVPQVAEWIGRRILEAWNLEGESTRHEEN